MSATCADPTAASKRYLTRAEDLFLADDLSVEEFEDEVEFALNMEDCEWCGREMRSAHFTKLTGR